MWRSRIAAPNRRSTSPSSGNNRFPRSRGPSLWIVAGRDLWEFLGRITLEAAGIDSITDEDCRSTWQEIVNQTMAGIAAAITADERNEVTASEGRGN